MNNEERLELLKAVLEVAVADGEVKRSELGVINGLAARVGIGTVSLQAMTDAAERKEPIGINIAMSSPERARQALELLVAEARIDGEIHVDERALLVRIGRRLRIEGDDFQDIYKAGIKRADDIRRSRGVR